MAVIQRSSPGILGIAFAIVLGLLMFTLCVPLCSTACGIVGLAGLAGLGSLSDSPDSMDGSAQVNHPPGKKVKRKRTPIAVGDTEQQESQVVETLDPVRSDQDHPEDLISEREAELQEVQVSGEPEQHQPLVQQTEEYLKAQGRVTRVCPDSLIPEETRVKLTEYCTERFDDGVERRDVIRMLRRKVKRDGWTYDTEMRKCLGGIVSLAQEEHATEQHRPTPLRAPKQDKPSGKIDPCRQWGKSAAYVKKLTKDYRIVKNAGLTEREILNSALDACTDRISNSGQLPDCRACMVEIVQDLFADEADD